MKLKKPEMDFFSFGLDRDSVDEDTYRGLYMVNVGNTIGFFFLLFLSVLYQWVSPVLVWLSFCSALVCLILLWINARWRDPVLSGRLGNGYFFFVLIAIISILGGIHSPTIAWLFVIPLGAGLTIGPRDAAFWTFASIVAIAFMYLIDSLDVYQGPGVPEHIQAVLNFILACFLILIFGVLLVTGLERHRILEVKLANSIKLQKNETETAQILADAASAANEEIEFERAAKDCLDIL